MTSLEIYRTSAVSVSFRPNGDAPCAVIGSRDAAAVDGATGRVYLGEVGEAWMKLSAQGALTAARAGMFGLTIVSEDRARRPVAPPVPEPKPKRRRKADPQMTERWADVSPATVAAPEVGGRWRGGPRPVVEMPRPLVAHVEGVFYGDDPSRLVPVGTSPAELVPVTTDEWGRRREEVLERMIRRGGGTSIHSADPDYRGA